MDREEKQDMRDYNVVMNDEEQYSVWPVDRETPLGWKVTGKSGLISECLEYIKQVWTDMRPRSLRNDMAQMEGHNSEINTDNTMHGNDESTPENTRDDLVKFLSEGAHRVEVSITPCRSAGALKECLDRGYVRLKFTDTRGATELGVKLDPNLTDLSQADFQHQNGKVRLLGHLTLNRVKVRCIAEIDLNTLDGVGHLEPEGLSSS